VTDCGYGAARAEHRAQPTDGDLRVGRHRELLVGVDRDLLVGRHAMAQLLRRLSGRGPSAAFHHMAQPSDIPDALPGYQLVHATVYFRHGSRAPVHSELPGAQDVAWEDCCQEKRARLLADTTLLDLGGGPASPSVVDQRQQSVKMRGGCCSGELTLTGAQQGVRLGKSLQERYGALLGSDGADRLTVRSTNVARCVMTARAVLFGLLGDAAASGPVPIATAPSNVEDLTPNAKRCARLAELWDEARRDWSQSAANAHPLHSPTLAALRRLMPASDLSAYGVEHGRWVPLKDILTASAALPSAPPLQWGVDLDLLASIDELAAAQVGHLMGHGRDAEFQQAVVRVGVGAALGRLASSLKAAAAAAAASAPAATSLKAAAASAPPATSATAASPAADVQAAPPAALSLFSGHDTTVLPLLTALGLWDRAWPPFCAALSFELWMPKTEEEGGAGAGAAPLVRVLFRTAPFAAPHGGGSLPPRRAAERAAAAPDGSEDFEWREMARYSLPQFAALVEPLVPVDLDAECLPRHSAVQTRRLQEGSQF